MNILCPICSDLINQAVDIYVTKCGHMFHHHCLAQWIERSKTCPQCRHKVTEKCMFRLYPTISNEMCAEDATTLQSRLDDANLQLRQQKHNTKLKDDKIDALMADLKNNSELIKSYEKKLISRDSAVSALKDQLEYLKIQNKETNRLREENDMLQKNIQTLNGLQKVLNATSDEVDKILQGYTDLRTIALFATSLKRALCDSESKKNEFRDKLHAFKQQLAADKATTEALIRNNTQLEDRLAAVSRKYEALKNKRKAEAEAGSRHKLPRTEPCDLDTAMLDASAAPAPAALEQSPGTERLVNSMVHRIESADSPYLSLKQSSLALATLHRQRTYPDHAIKPSEFVIINSARNHAQRSTANQPLSIFHKKPPLTPRINEVNRDTSLDISYDGLGGHSKLDIFPIPKQAVKTCVPRLTAKHKLKRPAVPAGSQDIAKLLEKMTNER